MYAHSHSPVARKRAASGPRAWAAATMFLIAIVGLGCGSGGSAPELDAGLAQRSLTTVLDAWKQGQTSDSLQQGSPKIVAVDNQWQSGLKLVDYKVLDTSTNDGSNLHVPVELELEDGAGVRSKQTVNYTVGTSPQITEIGRAHV